MQVAATAIPEVKVLTPRRFSDARGRLHGFAALAPDADVLSKLDAHCAPDCDGAVQSDKDAAAHWFRDFETPFLYEAAP